MCADGFAKALAPKMCKVYGTVRYRYGWYAVHTCRRYMSERKRDGIKAHRFGLLLVLVNGHELLIAVFFFFPYL